MASNTMNLGDLLTQTANRLPDQPAVVWRDRSWSWSDLNARVDALAHALSSLGLNKGDRVLIQARNSHQLIETLWACFKAGLVWTPCNFRLTPPEVAGLAESCQARAMIADAVFSEHSRAVASAVDLLGLVVIGGSAQDQASNQVDYEAFIAPYMERPFTAITVAYDDPAWFFFTSGTTGRPKAAVLTHGQLAFVVNNHLADLMPGTNWRSDCSLAVAPLTHGAGAHLLSQVARGVTTVLTGGTRFDEEEVWRLVARYRVTNMFTVPLILTRLVRHPSVDLHDHSSLRFVIYAGAPMYREDQRLALEKLGKVIVQYFGLGEVTGNITVLPPDEHDLDDAKMRVGSCGRARTGMEVAILDQDGEVLPPHSQGEICVRGPAVFAGYHNNPEANAKSLSDGWFHTGDLGRLDEAGYLWITGRASDMYISGGSNVYPREAEELLLTHAGVAEVAVLGVPDPQWGESGIAVVVPEETEADTSALESSLMILLQESLARYKHPKRIFFWEALPTSGYGKIPKHLVRNELYARGDLIEGQSP